MTPLELELEDDDDDDDDDELELEDVPLAPAPARVTLRPQLRGKVRPVATKTVHSAQFRSWSKVPGEPRFSKKPVALVLE